MRRGALAILGSALAACSLITGASDLVVGAAPSDAGGSETGPGDGPSGEPDARGADAAVDQDAAGPVAPGGVVDTTFGVGGRALVGFGASAQARVLTLATGGTIVVAGRSGSSLQANFAMARLTSAGALDGTFGTAGKTTVDFANDYDEATGLALRSDGRFIVTGRAWNTSLGGFVIASARVEPNGTLDGTFGTSGRIVYGAAQANNQDGTFSFTLGPGDAHVVGGSENGNVAVTAFVASGGAGPSGTVAGQGGVARALARQSDGKLVLAGWTPPESSATSSDVIVERRLADLSIDTTFAGGRVTLDIGALDRAYAIAVAADGKIVVAGETRATANADEDVLLLRLLPSGALDVTFGNGGRVITALGAGSADKGRAVALDASGRILLAGSTTLGPDQDVLLLRYDANGALDPTFGKGGVVAPEAAGTDAANDLRLAPDGRIVIAGSGQSASGSDFLVMRFSP